MLRHKGQVELLPLDALRKTGEVDHADWNYRPLLGSIQRMRFRLVRDLLSDRRFVRLLEVGYGSGIFLPYLSQCCDELYGVDVHPHAEEVAETLAQRGVATTLFSAGAESLPFDSDFFDCVVAVSALEFIADFETGAREIARVLKQGGSLVAVTPGSTPVVDFGLKLLTGASAKNDYGDRRRAVIPTLLHHFTVQRQLTFPCVGRAIVHLYTGLKLGPIKQRLTD
jgi:ubiquinone/menaquinone biosynthesis C-methylase UbiE